MACVPPGVQYDVVSNGVDSLFQTFRGETNEIPDDPRNWTSQDVRQWLRWAEDKFNLGIQDTRVLDQYDGKALCSLTKHDLCFNTSIAIGEILWESLHRIFCDLDNSPDDHIPQTQLHKPDFSSVKSPSSCLSSCYKRGTKPIERYSGKGPIQLWQFLLELLLDEEQTDVEWTGQDRFEFKIRGNENVAKLWGECKNNPTMNYEKLSRGLRFYYGKNIICKVPGKRYVYRFLCDIEGILGYDPSVRMGQKQDKLVAPEEKEIRVPTSACQEPNSKPEGNILSGPLNSVISHSGSIPSTDSFFGDNFETFGLNDFVFDGIVPDPILIPDDTFESCNMF